MALLSEGVAQELAEMHVFSELLKRGVAVYRSVGGNDATALVRHPDGEVLELKIRTNCIGEDGESSVFKTVEYKPDRTSFMLCVVLEGQEIEEVWVFPSMVFYAYSSSSRGKVKNRLLDLESGEKKYDAPLREYLRGFRNRWRLITEYPDFREMLTSPEGFMDLEDLVSAQAAFEEPEEDKVPWEEYVRSVSEQVSD